MHLTCNMQIMLGAVWTPILVLFNGHYFSVAVPQLTYKICNVAVQVMH